MDATERFSLEKVSLEDFRNYTSSTVCLSPGINIVFGQNAQGKTNLLEAIHLISTTRILRGSRDSEAIREGAERATVRSVAKGSGTEVTIQLQARTRKKALLNGMTLPRAADVLGRTPSVCFSSGSIPIVRGEPSDRRMFLDVELSQLSPAYLQHLSVYKRALEQRNALLKASQEVHHPAEHFEVWEAEMAHHGAALRNLRSGFVSDLSADVESCYRSIAGVERISIEYSRLGEENGEDELRNSYERERIREIHRGASTVGPHRDTLDIHIGSRDARSFGSQGQQRSAVIAMKMAVLKLATRSLGFEPILLLDDVFSDLDVVRRGKLLEMVCDEAGQVILTCTEPDQVGRKMLSGAKLIEIQNGKVIGQ